MEAEKWKTAAEVFFFLKKRKFNNEHTSPKMDLNLHRVHYLIYKFL